MLNPCGTSAAAAANSLQSSPNLCDSIDGSPPDCCPWDSPGKNTGVGCHFLLHTRVWDECSFVQQFEHSLVLPFFEIEMKTDLFQSCGHCWVFQILWHIECSTFTASSFWIWNSSTGIASPPIALFIVMLSKAHLTSHSRMSGSRLVTMSSWLSGSWRSFLYSSSVYSCHLLWPT